ncbi:MAG: alpha/beta hydrolase [Anaerolineae bacterium]|jgi:N-formylmaleamate deformylase
MFQWATGYVVSHGTNLHYYRSGGSGPALVLVHGISDDGLCWSPVAEVLSGTHDVVMVDLRGHGKSDAPEAGYDLVTMATELSGLITGLGLERPVILGHSLGAVITMTLAGLAPGLPLAIVLEEPPAFWRRSPHSPEETDFREEMRARFKDFKRKTRDDLLGMARSDNPAWSEAEIGPWADSKHRFSYRIAQIIDPLESVPEDFPAIVRRIACPALLITADPERGAILADDDVAGLRELLPRLEVIKIRGAGHNVRREQFADYTDAIRLFLAANAS